MAQKRITDDSRGYSMRSFLTNSFNYILTYDFAKKIDDQLENGRHCFVLFFFYYNY